MIKKNKLLFIFSLCILLICSWIAFQLFKPHFTQKPKNYTIGTTVYTVEDTLRTEIFTSKKNEKRKLIVQFWYPAMASDRKDYEPYIENADTVITSISELMGRPKFMFSPLKYKKSYALRNAKISSQKKRFR